MKQIIKVRPETNGLAMIDAPIKAPGENEVLIKISAASICGSDVHIYNWNEWAQNLYKEKLPMPMGHEFCGTIVEVGSGVKDYAVGERVCAETHIYCGKCDKCKQNRANICDNLILFSKYGAGCFSEYTTVPTSCLVKIPDYLDSVKASLMEPFGVSVYGVETAQISGKTLLIQGCGPLGQMAILIAKALGASRVYAVDADPYRVQIAKELGADAVLNPMTENVTEGIMELTHGIGVRAICEFTGSIPAIQTGFDCLAKGGRYIFTGMPNQKIEVDVVKYLINREIVMTGCYGRKIYETWNTAFELLETGRVNLDSIITHVLPLEEYEKAFEIALSRKCGKIVLVNE